VRGRCRLLAMPDRGESTTLRKLCAFAAAGWAAAALPAAAQDQIVPPAADTPEVAEALAGDFLVVGLGGALVPSYDGSDDYVLIPVPLVQGSIRGVGLNPRPGGLALDLIDDRANDGPTFSLGPVVRLRSSRAGQIEDEVVELLPELDRAIEIGASGGIAFPAVLNPYDSLSLSADVRWDVAGAHGGMTVAPSVSYTTPLSRGIAAILSVGGEWGGDEFMGYYYSVTPQASAITGLPVFEADAGFRSVGATMLLGFDLNGDLTDGGFSLFALAGYSRALGDAAETPFTSERGSADQLIGGLGVGYAF